MAQNLEITMNSRNNYMNIFKEEREARTKDKNKKRNWFLLGFIAGMIFATISINLMVRYLEKEDDNRLLQQQASKELQNKIRCHSVYTIYYGVGS